MLVGSVLTGCVLIGLGSVGPGLAGVDQLSIARSDGDPEGSTGSERDLRRPGLERRNRGVERGEVLSGEVLGEARPVECQLQREVASAMNCASRRGERGLAALDWREPGRGECRRPFGGDGVAVRGEHTDEEFAEAVAAGTEVGGVVRRHPGHLGDDEHTAEAQRAKRLA